MEILSKVDLNDVRCPYFILLLFVGFCFDCFLLCQWNVPTPSQPVVPVVCPFACRIPFLRLNLVYCWNLPISMLVGGAASHPPPILIVPGVTPVRYSGMLMRRMAVAARDQYFRSSEPPWSSRGAVTITRRWKRVEVPVRR